MPHLTARERTVAGLAVRGMTNREIAAELVISVKTVEHHLGTVFVKLGVSNRTQLAAQLGGRMPARTDPWGLRSGRADASCSPDFMPLDTAGPLSFDRKFTESSKPRDSSV
jgi:DNA-binding CsgD family transcriptional regulator